MNLTTRKTTFKQDLLRQVRLIPGGSKAYKNYLEQTALKFANDLARLGILPFKLKSLDTEKISKLVYLWKSEDLSSKTIMNRLAVLRTLAKAEKEPPYLVPDNQTFNLELYRYCKPLNNIDLRLNPHDIEDLDVQIVCLLQYLFGLKKREAIRGYELLITPDALIVPRKTSFNKIERRIRIANMEQSNLIAQLHKRRLINCPKYLSLLHSSVLKIADIEDKEYFRMLYIINRYKQLQPNLPKKEVLNQIQLETGFTSLRQIKGVLSCLEDF